MDFEDARSCDGLTPLIVRPRVHGRKHACGRWSRGLAIRHRRRTNAGCCDAPVSRRRLHGIVGRSRAPLRHQYWGEEVRGEGGGKPIPNREGDGSERMRSPSVLLRADDHYPPASVEAVEGCRSTDSCRRGCRNPCDGHERPRKRTRPRMICTRHP